MDPGEWPLPEVEPGEGRERVEYHDRQLRRGDGRRARLERRRRGPRRGRRHRAAGAPRPRGGSARRRLHARSRARAGARVRARRPRRPAALRAASRACSRSPDAGRRLSPPRLGGVRARVLPLGPRPAPRPAAGADLGLQVAARGRRLQRRAAARSARRAGTEARRPEAAARCFRVLAELGLVQGTPEGGDGAVGVVSSDETELERSGAFRAYSARYKECLRFLERHRHR